MDPSPIRFFDFPLEIRELVYRQLLVPEANRTKDADSYLHYKYDLSLLRANRRMHNEALDVFYRVNHFVSIETPWPQAQQHISIEGYIPVLLQGENADRFKHYAMLVKIDAPQFNVYAEPARRFVIHVDELHAFCEMWNYQNLSTSGLNQHLRLVLQLSNARPHPSDTEARPLPLPVQRSLIQPFGLVKELKEVRVEGMYEPQFEKDMRWLMDVPNKSAEQCLDEAARLKDLGNKASVANENRKALQYYLQSFRELHIICDGRRRSVWGDQYFQRVMLSGNHKGQTGGLARLILRVKLVANVVFAYVKMGTPEGYTWAHFWGMRTINLMRDMVEDEAEEPILDFPAANELGKIYFRTGVASRHLDKKDEARSLLRVAMAYLPNDPQVKQEYASVALKIG